MKLKRLDRFNIHFGMLCYKNLSKSQLYILAWRFFSILYRLCSLLTHLLLFFSKSLFLSYVYTTGLFVFMFKIYGLSDFETIFKKSSGLSDLLMFTLSLTLLI